MTADDDASKVASDADLERLLGYLRKTRGFDFAGYKRTSLSRRIHRRMQAIGIDSYGTYLDYLQVHPDEFPHLFNVILINVTSFFRDAEAWRALESHLRRVVEVRGPNAPIRAWCAGCASGEEAYSLAMALAEILGIEAFTKRVKIYATDVDEEALAQARAASYTTKAMESVEPRLVARYFARSGTGYLFNGDLRRAVIFGRHDLVQDAPISRVDILSCRNTLMYFNAETQSRVLARFNFALTNEGVLFLGKAEMLLTHSNLFTPLDLKLRLFKRTSRGGQRETEASFDELVRPPAAPLVDALSELRRVALDVAPLALVTLDAGGRLAVANVLAGAEFGLGPSDIGRPFHELELSYRPVELRSAIERTRAEGRPLSLSRVERVQGNSKTYLDIVVTPLYGPEREYLGTQLSFDDATRAATFEQDLGKLSLELEAAHEELQSTSEELETMNEELQSTVEELETTNEELQSTNEELETMNEELQSTNEELQTMNEELRERGEELNHANAFLGAILSSLSSGVVVLDNELVVRAWNHRMEDLWGVRADEADGKHFLNLDIALPIEKLRDSIRATVTGAEGPSVHELDCTNRRGRPIRVGVRVCAMRTDGIRGVLLVVEEIPR